MISGSMANRPRGESGSCILGLIQNLEAKVRDRKAHGR